MWRRKTRFLPPDHALSHVLLKSRRHAERHLAETTLEFQHQCLYSSANVNLENVFAHSAVGFHVSRQLAALRAAVSAHLTLVRLFSWTECFLVKRLHCIICWVDGMCGKHLTKQCKLMLYGRGFICSCYFMALYFILYGFILFNTFDHHLCDFSCALSGWSSS